MRAWIETRIATCPCASGRIEAEFDIGLFSKNEIRSAEIICDNCTGAYELSVVNEVNDEGSIVVLTPKDTQRATIRLRAKDFHKKIVELGNEDLDTIIAQHNSCLKKPFDADFAERLVTVAAPDMMEQYTSLLKKAEQDSGGEAQNALAKFLIKIANKCQKILLDGFEPDYFLTGKDRFFAPALYWAIKAVEQNYPPAYKTEKNLVSWPSDDVKQDLILAKALLLKGVACSDNAALLELAEEYAYPHSKIFPYDLSKANQYYRILIGQGQRELYPDYIYTLSLSGQLEQCKNEIKEAIKLKDGDISFSIFKKLYPTQLKALDDTGLELYLLTQAEIFGSFDAQQARRKLYVKTLFGREKRAKNWGNWRVEI